MEYVGLSSFPTSPSHVDDFPEDAGVIDPKRHDTRDNRFFGGICSIPFSTPANFI
jgi:hypothetical protein